MRKTLFASLFALALVLIVSPLALAETPEAEPNMSTAPTAPADQLLPSAFATQGMKAFINPETGEFRQPTDQEAAALRQFLFQRFHVETPAPVEHQMADGTVYALLDPSLHEAVTVTKAEDGSLHLSCEANHAQHAHDAPVETPARAER